MDAELDYREIRYRLEQHGTFKLFRKERAALMLAFFVEAVKKGHRSDIPRSALVSELSAFRDYLSLTVGEESAAKDPDTKSAAALLDEWADDGFLRKYYRAEAAEPSYDLTPESEKAIEWLRELSERRFVGAESRLLKVFDLMKDIAYGAAFDAEERISELERRKAEIDTEIARVRSGAAGALDPTAVRERYYELEDTARRLLADFRQIELNFRKLDRDARARVIAADKERGRVLKDIFEFRDAILSSDQGKSFQAFWAFVMSSEKKSEFAALAGRVLSVPEVEALPKSVELAAFDRLLVSAGARVQRTAHLLNEELRVFLDEKSRREGRAVAVLAEEIKKLALSLRDEPPADRAFIEFEDDPDIDLVMERPLFEPEEPVRIADSPEEQGESDADAAALFSQAEIDRDAIRANIAEALLDRPQIALAELLERYPVTDGGAEILGYLAEACAPGAAMIVDGERTELRAENRKRGTAYRVGAPEVVYIKDGSTMGGSQ